MSALWSDWIANIGWLVPSSVFVAGLIGSPHCVAMCGPLAATFGRRRRTLVAYQAGRMVAYTIIGALAGAFGHALFRAPSPVTAAIGLLALALLLVVFAVSRDRFGSHTPNLRWIRAMNSRIWMAMRKLDFNPTATSFSAGVLTIFLPCLHLYAFVTGAAATSSAWGGATFMFVFWLSTVPALSAAPLFLRKIFAGSTPTTGKRWVTVLLLVAALVSLGQFALHLRPAEPNGAIHHHEAVDHSHHH